MSGTTTGGDGGGPHAVIKHGNKEVPVSESEWASLLEWLKEHHPHIYHLLTGE